MKVKIDEYQEFKRWCDQNGYADVVLEDKPGLENFDLRKFLLALDDYARAKLTNKSPWLTLKEAAARIKVTPDTLSNYVSRGIFPYCKSLSGTKRFHIEDVDRWFMDNRVAP